MKKQRMGTNYYYKDKYCKHCGRYDEKHIGKSSAGWQFTFRLPDGVTLNSIYQMKEHLIGRLIKDEYGKDITHDEFWKMVEQKQGAQRSTHCLIDVQGYDFIDSDFS